MTTPYDTYKSAILGVPFDANKKPSRQGAVKAFSEMQVQLEAAQAGALVSDTLVNANLMTNVPAVNTMLWVLNDTSALSGIYANEGTAAIPVFTTKLANIPQFLITGVNTGVGTVNAIQASTDLALPDEDGRALIVVNIVGANTTAGPTVSFDAGVTNLIIKTNSGSNVEIGGLTTNMNIAGVISNSSTEFRLISDQASAAIQAASEAALAEFKTMYLGPLATEPTTDLVGNPLLTGALYFNTTSSLFRYWDGTAFDNFPNAIVADGSITAVKLAADAVTTVKVLDGAITAAKLATDAVITTKILDGAITKAKIAGTAINEIPNEITLYRNAGAAVLGPVSAAAWAFPGLALTASTSQFYAQWNLELISARWLLAWNPNSPTASASAVRLIHADSGPTNITQIASFVQGSYTTPRVDAVDVTTALQALLTAGVQKTLGHQCYGNGTNAAAIYLSVIECRWRVLSS